MSKPIDTRSLALSSLRETPLMETGARSRILRVEEDEYADQAKEKEEFLVEVMVGGRM
jgi:hypothetical protein